MFRIHDGTAGWIRRGLIVGLAALGVGLLLTGIPYGQRRFLRAHPALRLGHTRQVALWRPPRSLVAGWIIAENRRPGSAAWRIGALPAMVGIQAYADRMSVGRTGLVTLFVSTTAAAFRVDAYRMGWYQGLGGRLVWRSRWLPGAVQSSPVRLPLTNTIEARWRPSVRVWVGPAWPPGDYLLKLVGSDGAACHVPLTVRDDASRAAILVQNSVATWQAYNRWGGWSLYHGPGHRRATIVSFDRPYAGDGSGDFLRDELPLIQTVERDGLDVTYWTDIDLHEHPALLRRHRVLVTLGHDEYWSLAMRQGAQTARDHGVNLLFLGANAVYRHIRLEPSPLGPDRREVNYRVAALDPLSGVDNADVTVQWRAPPTNFPESGLIGEQYECNPVRADMIVVRAASWIFAGTGLRDGDRLRGIVGYEYDRVMPGAPRPRGLRILAHSPVRCLGRRSFSDMTYYTASSGAGVLATGTISWICALTDSCVPGWGDPADGPLVRRVTENVLGVFGLGPAARRHAPVRVTALGRPRVARRTGRS
jgi:hypothetical protein